MRPTICCRFLGQSFPRRLGFKTVRMSSLLLGNGCADPEKDAAPNSRSDRVVKAAPDASMICGYQRNEHDGNRQPEQAGSSWRGSPSDNLSVLVTDKSGICWAQYREARCRSSVVAFTVACAPASAVEDRNTRPARLCGEPRSLSLG
jgi:hypothetical protein